MRAIRSHSTIKCAGILPLVAILAGSLLFSLRADQPAPNIQVPPVPQSARLGANVYLQTSPEYRACCLQVYKCAGLQLEIALGKPHAQPFKPAVIMDLDETVLDNSAFQTFLFRNGLGYTDALWADYEENYAKDVTLVPGAKGYIDLATRLGVTVVFISNRVEKFRKSTEWALNNLGVGGEDLSSRLKLKSSEPNTPTDKTARRDRVFAQYNVLQLFGDNVRDFSELFVVKPSNSTTEGYLEAVRQRQNLVDLASCHWGTDWFVIPNPVYGDWDRATGPDPLAIFHPTSMTKPLPK